MRSTLPRARRSPLEPFGAAAPVRGRRHCVPPARNPPRNVHTRVKQLAVCLPQYVVRNEDGKPERREERAQYPTHLCRDMRFQ